MFKNAKRSIMLGISRFRLVLLKLLLGDYVKNVIVASGDNKFVVSLADCGVGRSMMKNGAYSPDELEILEELLSNDSNVLVVGAHVGGLALPLSRRCTAVTCIEANPDTFELLQLNRSINNITNVSLHNFAAGEIEGALEFLVSTDNSGGSKRYPNKKKEMYFYDAPKVISVPMKALDDEFPAAFDIVIMDIEGSEYFALKGMQAIIAKTRVLVVEFIPHHLRYVADIDVATFLEPICDHFQQLEIPSLNRTVGRDEFLTVLTSMFDNDLYDDGIVFSKVSI